MSESLSGKRILVTGAGSGIGRATAKALAEAGARVMASDIDATAAAETAEIIGGKGAWIQQDVTSEETWINAITETEKTLEGMDGLIANAGIAITGRIETFSLEDWRRQQAINVDGVFLGVKHSIPALRRAGGGSIAILSSIAGLRGNSVGLAAYSATKGAVRLFSKCAALECARGGDNIRVNSVHPGIIDTPIWEKMGMTGTGHTLPSERAAALAPMGRSGDASEIADSIVFLMSDASRYMTGAELVIDGGVTA